LHAVFELVFEIGLMKPVIFSSLIWSCKISDLEWRNDRRHMLSVQ